METLTSSVLGLSATVLSSHVGASAPPVPPVPPVPLEPPLPSVQSASLLELQPAGQQPSPVVHKTIAEHVPDGSQLSLESPLPHPPGPPPDPVEAPPPSDWLDELGAFEHEVTKANPSITIANGAFFICLS
jgi:hypothetical protein